MPFHDGLPEILPPREDGVFKSTFTREAAKPALLELLSDILDRPLKDVKIRNNEPPISDVGAKREVFDINCLAEDDKSQYDIEMQATPMEGDKGENEHRHIRNRAVFNLSDLHASQPGRGVRYGDFFNSYQIMICNYNVFNWENELVERFTYRNERGNQLSDITTAIFIDLTQASKIILKSVAEMSAVEQWAVFLAKADDPQYRETMREILSQKEGIFVAYEMLTSISADENERARFRSRRIWENDQAHNRAVREHEIAEAVSSAVSDEREKWASVVADKDARIADKDKSLADKDARIADKDARIAELERQLGERK
ncbi:MAG: Rpn family recombination-promoting nuclease/putative transposase [Oscillospiraceae bacterium]|jgi:predicted transposase/invertase (TIGR01784 family)|nr:Rpn family recombination-promoting nuclease/putative transposase [Oscillospiraceae bacterium]